MSVIVRHEYWRLLSAFSPLRRAPSRGQSLRSLSSWAATRAIDWLDEIPHGLSAKWDRLGRRSYFCLRRLGRTDATQLVGASGAIMGVIGISAGLLLRHRRTTLAGRQLQNILVIVAIQTAFDLWTPQISMAAHLSGFLSGIVVGLIFASLDRPTTTSLAGPQKRPIAGLENGILGWDEICCHTSALLQGHTLGYAEHSDL